MSRHPRLVVPGFPHHVYLRGNNRRRLFSDDGDRLLWLSDLRQGIEASQCLLHQLTLMDNHVHMIVTPPDNGSLAVLMKRACQRYAQRRNHRFDASGKLFEERYRSKLIENDRQWLVTTLYNDANAYRAGMVASPLEHAWSTGPLHAGRRGSRISPWLWSPAGWYMNLAKSANRRAEAYAYLMDTYSPFEERPSIEEEDDGDEDTTSVFRPDGTDAR